MANGNDDQPKVPRLGEVPQKYRLITPEERLARKQEVDSGPLIGGKDSTAVGSFVGNVVGGAAGVLASPFKAIDRALASAAGAEYREDVASPIGRLGQGIEDVASTVAAGDPERAEDFSSKLAQGFGSTAGFLIPGAILGAGARGAAGIAGLGAAATGVEQAEDYERTVQERGGAIDLTKQGQALFAGMLPGTLEAVPLTRMLTRLDDVAKGGLSAAIKNTAKGTVEEALQEGIQSTASNLIASDLIKYDAERDMFFDTPEAAAVGGGVGFLMNSLMSAIGLRQRGKYTETAVKSMDTARKEAAQVEEEQAKVNPATGEAIENSQIAKTNKLIQRYSRLAKADPTNQKVYEQRVADLKKELEDTYFEKNEQGEFTKSAADRMEATDVLTGRREEVEITAPVETPTAEDFVREAEPLPTDTKGIRLHKDITSEKRIAKFNEDLARIYTPEEIAITGLQEPLPTTEGIQVEEEVQDPTVEEIDLDTTPTIPERETFLSDRPANRALAIELERIQEQRKRRNETDDAFEARKEAEIEEAYRQREFQLAEQEPVFETEEETIQPTTAEPTSTPTQEQTQEEVRGTEAQAGIVPEGAIVTKSGKGFKSEAIANVQRKRRGIEGDVVEYTPGEFAIVPQEVQDGQEERRQLPTEEEVRVPRQAFPGEIAEDIQGPVDLRRQAGLPDDLTTLPPLEQRQILNEVPPTLREREGIPTPNGTEVVPEGIKNETEVDTTPVKPRDSHLDVADRLLEEVGRARDIGRYSEEDVSTEQRQIKKILDNPKLSDKQKFTALQSSLSAATRKNNSYRPTTDTEEVTSKDILVDEIPIQSVEEKVTNIHKSSIRRSDITTKTGSPFKSASTAKAQLSRRGLAGTYEVTEVDGGFVLRRIEGDQQNPVDDNAGYEPAGKDLSEGTVEQVVNSPVEKPEQIPLDAEVYDRAVELATKMRESQNPQRFLDDIERDFETLQQFLAINSGIEAGVIVRAGENTPPVMTTPVGTVETVEEVHENPVESNVVPEKAVNNNLDDIESRLDILDIEVQDLQDQLEDPYLEASEKSDLKKQIARKKKEIKQLEAQQQGVFAEKKKISEDEIKELKTIDHEVTDYTDTGLIEPSESVENITIDSTPAPRPEDIALANRAVDRFVSQMDPLFRAQVEYYIVTKPSDIPANLIGIKNDYVQNWENTAARGLYYQAAPGRKDIILIIPKAGMTRESVERTIYHETIGHFGFKRIFGKQWETFMDILLKNPDLAAKAYSLGSRWEKLGEKARNIKGMKSEDLIDIKTTYEYTPGRITFFTSHFTKKTSGVETITVSKAAMRRLLDEYLAEIAGNMSQQTYRDVTKQERSLMNRVRAWVRHLLRKAGVNIPITDGEVLSFVGESYARIMGADIPAFEGTVGSVLQEKKKEARKVYGDKVKVDDLVDATSRAAVSKVKAVNENVLQSRAFVVENGGTPQASVAPSEELLEAHAAVDEAIDMAVDLGFTASREEALRTLRSIDAREGRLDNSTHQRRIERVSDWLRRSKLGKVLSSNGHLPFYRILNAVEAKGKGGIELGQVFARKFARLTKDMNDIQKEAMYNYFKTKDADVETVPVDKEVKKVLSQAKDYIERYGESLVIQGKLSRETWEASRGSYLPIRYWQYMEGYYAAGGKRLSVQDYLKKQKGLSEEEKAALGEVKDVSFLVPETIATISRDVALNGMFKNIITFDEVGKLGWTLGERQFTEVEGKKMKLSDIEKKIESLEFIRDSELGVMPLMKDQKGQEEIERQLLQYYEARDIAKNALSEEIRDVLAGRGITEVTQDMINQVRDREYVQVNDKRYGALHKKYIRKELYEEIVESGTMFDREHADFFGKAFGAGGYADRANQRWKSLKVTLNPPSWFRNGIGNLILMDIGTNTNINKLVGMLVSEANSWRKGNPSRYFHMAHENGLWATTYSAAELNLMAREFKDAFKSEIKIDSSRNFMKKAWWMFDEKVAQIFEKGTEIYGGMEGFFKTVALRDYIERWEKENGSIDNAEPRIREAVIREAVEAANNNIFDYSKVPGWMRTMRRMPFIGAPFLTYTFKAFPYVMESFARRPQKFIKYAALPYVFAQAFMLNQDMDDEDYDEIMRLMPKWQKEKSSIYLLPWKDANGNFQTIDFGYYLPWAPFHNLGLMAGSTFDVNNPIMSSLNVVGNLGTDLGFLGGPIPQMTSALITNKDPFTGQEIVRTAGTTLDKQNDFMRYMVDMWTPTFLTSKGVLGRTLDNLGVEPTVFNTGRQLNSLGKDKETWVQSSLRAVGVSSRPLDPQVEMRNKIKAYQFEKRKIETARRQIFKDRNLSPESKASKIRELNEQIKLLNQKHREEITGG